MEVSREEISRVMAALGRKGGKVRSDRKRAAAVHNLDAANQALKLRKQPKQ